MTLQRRPSGRGAAAHACGASSAGIASRAVCGAFLLVAMLLAAFPARLDAQLGQEDILRIVRIDTDNFPTVRVHVRAFCKGVQEFGLSTVTMTVQDGAINKSFTLRCPTDPVPISVALAIDRSGSVSGTTILRIQQGAWDFVQLFQSRPTGNDEAAIITFADDVTVHVPMTPNTNDLLNAIPRIYPFGATALWDGVMRALYEVYTFGVNPVKAVIVLSDGGDNASTSDLPAVIAYARQLGIPVYAICATYHASIQESAAMRMLADSTGGMYIPIDHPDRIIDAYNALASIITGGANDCIVEYQTACPDGSWREVTVTAQACGQTLTAKKRYRVPLDLTLPAVAVEFDSVSAYENGDVYIPIRISAIGSQARITQMRFKVLERDPIRFVQAITAPHFAGRFTVDARVVVDSLLVQLDGDETLTGSDTLMVLRYKAGSVPRDSVVQLLVFLFEKNTEQCMRLTVRLPDLLLRPRAVLATACTDTVRVAWDPANGTYAPDVIPVTANISNTGSIAAMNPRAWIRLPYGVELAGGSDTVLLGPAVLGPGFSTAATFPIRVLPSDSARTLRICVYVQADSGVVSECCTVLDIARGKPALRMQCALPSTVRWIDSLQRFDPDTFPVTITITNVSPVVARTPEAWIHIPEGFDLSGPTPINTSVQPALLRQQDTASVTWMLTPKDRMTSDTLRFCIKTAAGLDTAVCCSNLYITKSPVRATLACLHPTVITWDDEKRTYDPPQFLMSTVVRNTSGNPMYSAQGRIFFPPYIQLAPGETQVKNLPGGAVVQPGDSVQVTWILAGSGPPSGTGQICIDISASNFPGARCCAPIDARSSNTAASLACALTGPDTIRYTDTGYAPNPFTLGIRATNTGSTMARGVSAVLAQGADLSIEAPDQSLKLLADSLIGGASVDGSFTIRVLDRPVSRFDSVRVTVYATNGGAAVCEKVVYIEAVRGPAMQLSCDGPDSLVFSDSLNTYLPSPFTVVLDARNVGTMRADSVTAELLPPGNIELVAGERAAKPLVPDVLQPGERGAASWQARAVPRSVARMDTVRLQVRHAGRNASVTPCPVPIYIPAARSARLEVSCTAPDPLRVVNGRFEPDPFLFQVRVRNTGDARAFDPLVSVISQGRLQLAAGEVPIKPLGVLAAETGEAVVTFGFTAVPGAQGDSATVCFRVGARFQNDAYCCVSVYLPPLETGAVALECAAPDTVRPDPVTRMYPKPLIVSAVVRNTGAATVDSARLTLTLPNGTAFTSGEVPDRIVRNIPPAGDAAVQWQVEILPDTATVLTVRRLRVTVYALGETRICERSIVVVPLPRDTARPALTTACTSPDTIRYIDAQIGLQPSPFAVSVEVINTGTAPLDGVTATLTLPPGVTLSPGDAPTRQLQFTLQPGQRAVIAWSCVPAPFDSTRTAMFEIVTDAGAAGIVRCTTSTVIRGIELLLQVTAPAGVLGRLGELVEIPLRYRNPQLAPVRSFRLDLQYDERVLAFVAGFPRTQSAEWDAVSVETPSPGIVRFSGTSPVQLGTQGILAGGVFRVISGDGTPDAFGVLQTPLHLEQPVFPRGVRVELRDGDIWTMGECLLPLYGGVAASLAPNRPNPFNPVTTISYVVPEGMSRRVILEVYDSFGRPVRTLVDDFRDPGAHSVVFDAAALPSGVYYSRLRIDGHMMTRRMVLAR